VNRRASGQATVELALVLPLLAFAMLAILQVALVARDQLVVVHTARETARTASRDPNAAHALEVAGRRLPGAAVDFGGAGDFDGEVTVTVRYRSVTDLPLIGAVFPDPELSASATFRSER
jgi:hypothetical protein